jgi:SH3 domain protein
MAAAHKLALMRTVLAAAATVLGFAAGSVLAQTEEAAPPSTEAPASAQASTPIQGQTQYVIEQLVVSVNAQPDGSGERVDQIKSGDRVEMLEHQGDQAHVRLSSGQEGWVRSSYLSTAPPLREQLKARTDELEKLRTEKTKLETELTSVRKAAAAAAAQSASAAPSAPSSPRAASGSALDARASETAPEEPESVESAATDTARSNPPMFASDGGVPSRPSWLVAIAVSLLTLVAGFALGWRVLDKRIRAKYGGLRIY